MNPNPLQQTRINGEIPKETTPIMKEIKGDKEDKDRKRQEFRKLERN